ncbi:MAG: DUF2207 domain-containing protein [Bacilli bacterium]
MNMDVLFILIFAIYILSIVSIVFSNVSQKFVTSKSKYNKLHKCSVIFLVFGVILMAIFSDSVLINKVNRRSTSTAPSSADGFTIEQYKIVMDVNESNSVDVKEYITVNFYESGHHGIYRFIPFWLEYTNKDGVTQSRESKLSNLKAVGDNYTIDTVSGKQRIKIGDANYTLPVGNHTYEIDYTYDMGFDPYDNFDEFIFHAFGDYWGTEIKNASIIINLPKAFDTQNKIKFFADKHRKQDITSYVNYYASGNTIYADLSSNYRLNSALTIDIELPDGYFVNGSNNYGITSLLLCVLCILFAIISFVLWKKNGKDLDKIPETVEFYPPEKLDAAEIGYLYKKDTGRKLSIALIIELASKGFIKIIESEDKETLTIVKSNTTDVNKYIKREIRIVKLKEYKERSDTFDNTINSIKIMKDYFPDNVNENIVTSDFNNFYENSKYLIDNGYIRIVSDSISQYSQEQLDTIKKELSLNEFKDKPQMSNNEKIVYNKLFEDSDETILSENYSFYKVFSEIGENVRNNFDDKINDLKAYKYMLIVSLGFLICTILFGLAYYKFEDLNPKLNIIYTIAFISNIVTFVFAILMKRKNLYGEQIKSKINGFKNYIELAEKDQIEMLVEQNPNYFYDILPYAYVLDVSKKWVEKFENIPVPTNDMGNFDYNNIDSLDHLSDFVYIPSSSSSGSSGCGGGCGGGCSSCGGGCSSCGGGGSW